MPRTPDLQVHNREASPSWRRRSSRKFCSRHSPGYRSTNSMPKRRNG